MKLLSTVQKMLTRFTWREWCVVGLILVGAFLRFYKLENALFQGDQGRDALVVAKIFREHDFVFIGPVTSIGNMYLGPFYYYFMLPFLMLTFPSPIGPVIAIAFFSTLLLFCLYYFGQELIGKQAALFATILMTFSTVIVSASRSSWNPNLAPFVGFFLVYTTFRALKNERYWLGVSLCAAILLQLHYVTLLGVAAAALVWVVQAGRLRSSTAFFPFLKTSTVALGIFLLSFLPLFLFDFKHNWLNLRAAETIVSSSENFGYASSFEKYTYSIWDIHNKFFLLMSDLVFHGKHVYWQYGVVALLVCAVVSGILKKKKVSEHTGIVLLSVFIGVTSVGLAFYRHSIFDHYVIFILPAVFLALGWALQELVSFSKAWIPVVVAVLAYTTSVQVPYYTFRPSGPTFAQLAERASEINQHLQPHERYILLLLSESHDILGMNYRYFLTVDPDKKPLEPGDLSQADTLVIINEEKKTDKPQDLPLYEMVTFPSKEPAVVIKHDDGPDIFIFRRPN